MSERRDDAGPTGAANDRDLAVSACLEEYHARQAAGQSPALEDFAARLTPEDYAFFDTLVDTDALLDDPDPTVHDAPLPRKFGDYTLLREVGRGATGVVYEGVESGLRRSVAIKILKANFGDDDLVRERFLREADACSQIDHANVVTVFKSGEEEGHPFYAMSYVDGRPLSKMLGAEDLDVSEICRRASEVADALSKIHDAGIVHRDVKPGNIMVAPDGRWILTDFGHVHNDAALTLTKSGDAMGTPLYMSPEQARGTRGVDGRADVYGLGATLYHLITGTPVFEAEDVQGVMRAILMDRAQSMSSRGSAVPATLDRVVLKCLEKRPDDRYADMSSLAADLRAVAEGRATAGRPVSLVARAMRWIPEHPVRTAAAVLVAAGFVWALGSRGNGGDAPTLMIETLPGATIAVKGHPDRTAPLAGPIELALGLNEFTVSHARFRSRSVKLPTHPGDKHNYAKFALSPEDPDDEEAQRELLVFLGVIPPDAPTFLAKKLDEGKETHRAASKTVTAGVYPRGMVTRDDLDRFLVSSDEDFEVAAIVWMRGDDEIHRQTFAPENMIEAAPIHPAVRDALKVGDVLTWRIETDTGYRTTAHATLVPASEADLSALEAKLPANLPRVQRQTLRARAWLAKGFATKAFRASVAQDGEDAFNLAALHEWALRALFQADPDALAGVAIADRVGERRRAAAQVGKR